jgi:putative oxygen-independent coproporphyrinogen III oxidase
MAITSLPPLSLYIHTPWCVQKCPYCDFNSHQQKQTKLPESAYVDRLLFDLEQEMPSVWGRQLTSIFIGGGTPSLFSPESFDRLLSGIRALLPFQSDIEITMEANPGTVEAEKFKGFFQAGINRISIGVQSFNNQHLKVLGRIHDSNEASRAFYIAREAGFKNINLDLMYALPEQTVSQAVEDLEQAIALKPEHLSWYQLTLEPNTLFYHQPPSLPNDDLMIDIAEKGLEVLIANNYQRYEVSAYSLAGKKPSQHNLNYWQFGDYLGIGAGAHQKITRADTQTICRKSKRRSPKNYLDLELSVTDSEKTIAQQELPFEFMLNVLRLKNGVPQSLFFETTGILLSQLENVLQKAESKQLICRENQQIKATELGFQFLNELLEMFLPDNFPQLKSDNQISIKAL